MIVRIDVLSAGFSPGALHSRFPAAVASPVPLMSSVRPRWDGAQITSV